MLVGVLALQGAFDAHRRALDLLGVESRPVRRPHDLSGIDALILPGGESTTLSMLIDSAELTGPIRSAISDGLPMFGTCAGMILLSSTIDDGRADQHALAAIDITVRRNGYGRQRQSFETDITLVDDQNFHGVFIRAPRVTEVGSAVAVLAVHDGDPVLLEQGPILVASFHPELTTDPAVHRLFLERTMSTGLTS